MTSNNDDSDDGARDGHRIAEGHNPDGGPSDDTPGGPEEETGSSTGATRDGAAPAEVGDEAGPDDTDGGSRADDTDNGPRTGDTDDEPRADDTDDRIDQLEAEKAALEKEVTRLTTEKEELKAEKAALEEEVSNLQLEKEELEEEMGALQSSVDTLSDQLAEARTEASHWEERHEEVSEQFENYKQRREEQLDQELREMKASFVAPLFDEVRSELARIVAETEEGEGNREAVRLVLENFDGVLEQEEIGIIDPDPGTPLDRDRHEVIETVDADVDGREVEEVWNQGFTVDGEVLQQAEVVVRR